MSELHQFKPKSGVHYKTLLGPPLKGAVSSTQYQKRPEEQKTQEAGSMKDKETGGGHSVTCDHNEMACDHASSCVHSPPPQVQKQFPHFLFLSHTKTPF